MNKFIKLALIPGLVSSLALTGCIDEVEPTNGVTQEQLDRNEDAGRALLYAMPGFMNNYNTQGQDNHIDFGYASMMRIRDLMTGDMVISEEGANYDHYTNYEQANVPVNYVITAIPWYFYNKAVLTCNKVLATFPETAERATDQGTRAIALTYRAMLWLDLARWYECLPTDESDPYVTPKEVTDENGQVTKLPGYTMVNSEGNNVEGLTVPIVTENTTEAEAFNNPRATRQQMADQILKDLLYAVDHIEDSPYYQQDILLPDLSCTYGLLARLYMWLENYPEAARYAGLAIQEAQAAGCSVLTESDLLSPTTGFNTLSAPSWMWGFKPEAENRTVTTGICNWVSMTSVEADYGYAAVGAGPVAVFSFYDRIDNNDIRKLWWIPESEILLKKMQFCAGNSKDIRDAMKATYPYSAVKFRPAEGETSDYTVASTAAVPLMRLEEMYFIKFEAEAHTSATQGFDEMKSWIIANRNAKYKPKASAVATDAQKIEEIVFQKRVELWGEGHTLFDIKRLNMSVDRTCAGYRTNNVRSQLRLRSVGRPAWMNFIIIQSEGLANTAIKDFNNPMFSGLYQPVK